jgi:integrase-like protein/integrase family protein with SAM-like domain
MEEFRTYGSSNYSRSIKHLGLSEGVVKLLNASCSKSTWSTYNSQYKKFQEFCNIKGVNIENVKLSEVLSYLSSLFESNLGYSTINTTRSALSLLLPKFDGVSLGEHPLVTRLLKGVSKLRPPQAKYKNTWDVSLVTNYIKRIPDNNDLDFKLLSYKLVGLLAVISGQRVQTLSKILIENVKSNLNECKIFIPANLKTSSVNSVQPCITVPKNFKCKKLCVKSLLDYYLKRTESIRSTSNLFVSLQSPHGRITSQTISRWLVKLLELSNVDISIYKGHSYRHASTSKAFKKGVNIETIFNNAGWSKESKMFAKFYNRTVSDVNEFSNAVLNK